MCADVWDCYDTRMEVDETIGRDYISIRVPANQISSLLKLQIFSVAFRDGWHQCHSATEHSTWKRANNAMNIALKRYAFQERIDFIRKLADWNGWRCWEECQKIQTSCVSILLISSNLIWIVRVHQQSVVSIRACLDLGNNDGFICQRTSSLCRG